MEHDHTRELAAVVGGARRLAQAALTASNFTVSEVGLSGNYTPIGSDPVFVLDDNPSTAASLWYDGDGDGLGAIKVADFNSTSVLAGFDHEDFFLV